MPRLEGERSNTGVYVLLLLVLLVVVFLLLEYFGVINTLPTVGGG